MYKWDFKYFIGKENFIKNSSSKITNTPSQNDTHEIFLRCYIAAINIALQYDPPVKDTRYLIDLRCAPCVALVRINRRRCNYLLRTR